MQPALRRAVSWAGLVEMDHAVSKALRVSEVARIARIETRLRQLLLADWTRRVREASGRAATLLLGHGTTSEVMRQFDKLLRDWPRTVKRQYLDDIEEVYRLARTAAWKKATGQIEQSLQYDIPSFSAVQKAAVPKPPVVGGPKFDLVDTAAVRALRRKETFWMGDYYPRGVQDSIREVSKQVISQGRWRKFGRRRLVDRLTQEGMKVNIPGRYAGRAGRYLDGVVSNAVTVARVQGTMRSFVDLGITRYEIINPMDERSCFRYGTPVLMADGTWKAIQDILPGEKVITRAGQAKKVLGRFVKTASRWAVAQFEDGAAVRATADHLLAEEGGGWVETELSLGHRVERIVPASHPGLSKLRPGIQQTSEPGSGRQRELLQYGLPLRKKTEPPRRVARLRGVWQGVQGDAVSTQPDVLLGRMRPYRVGRRAIREHVPPLRQENCRANEAGGQVQVLQQKVPFGARKAGAWSRRTGAGLSDVWPRVQGQAMRGRDRKEAALFIQVLPKAGQTIWSRAARSGSAGRTRLEVHHRAQARPLGGGLLYTTIHSDRGRRIVLALKASREVEGRAQDSAAGGDWLQSPSRAGVKSERQRGAVQLHRFASQVSSVSLTDEPQLAYDIEVEHDHSYVVWPGAVVHNCPVCSHMNGKVFEIDHGTKIMEREINATTPEGVRAAHPWLTVDKLLALSSKPGAAGRSDADALAAAGFAVPPFHFKCRCTVDSTFNAGSWQPSDGIPPSFTLKLPGTTRKVTATALTTTPGVPKANLPKDELVGPTEFDRDRLVGAFDDLLKRGGTTAARERAQRIVRQQMNSLLNKYGMISQDVVEKKIARDYLVVMSKPAGNAIGLYQRLTGRISVTRNELRGAAQFLKTKIGSGGGMQTLVHETAHAHSPYRSGAVWKLSKKQYQLFCFMEETTTELATEHVMMNEFALSQSQHAFTMGYRTEVESFVGTVQRAFAKGGVTLNERDAREIARRASVSWKSITSGRKQTFTPKKMLSRFKEHIQVPTEHTGAIDMAERAAKTKQIQDAFEDEMVNTIKQSAKRWAGD